MIQNQPIPTPKVQQYFNELIADEKVSHYRKLRIIAGSRRYARRFGTKRISFLCRNLAHDDLGWRILRDLS